MPVVYSKKSHLGMNSSSGDAVLEYAKQGNTVAGIRVTNNSTLPAKVKIWTDGLLEIDHIIPGQTVWEDLDTLTAGPGSVVDHYFNSPYYE